MLHTPNGRHKVDASEDLEDMSHYSDGSSITLSTLYRLLIWCLGHYHAEWWSDPGTIDTYADKHVVDLERNEDDYAVANPASDVYIVHAGEFGVVWCWYAESCCKVRDDQVLWFMVEQT